MRTRILLCLASLCLMATPVRAQTCVIVDVSRPTCDPPYEPRLHGHLTALGLNMAIGAVTVGVAQAVRGGSFWEGAAAGALGGGLSYTGKLVVTTDFSGSGLAGREIAALGSSVVTNAMSGAGLFDEAVLPFGPLRFQLQRVPERRVRARVDVPNLMLVIYSAARSDLSLDWSASLSSGAFVFVDRAPPDGWAGRHLAGVIFLKDGSHQVGRDNRKVLKHERVHLLQHDFTYGAWGRPAQGWLLDRGSVGSRIHSFTDLRLDMLAWLVMNGLISREDRPSEREAYFLVPSPEPDFMPALTASRMRNLQH